MSGLENTYIGLARKWRPQTFHDLVGQEHIRRTLSSAIKTSKVAHGYLFTGTRGIGKTSAARILAKTLRCQNLKEDHITPCNQCRDCIEISEGRSVDVLEIDGASNNGVDAIREIRENAKFLPSSGTRKIYIIDEVHMLTTAAFNALLKTLEEPPAHVIFIFATTDPQKIPVTVLSRCQRFDFKRVSEKDLRDRVLFIAQKEGIEIEDQALVLLCREAEGSLRDVLSLLDQIMSTGSEKISAAILTDALGLVDRQIVLRCAEAILKRDSIGALDSVGQVYLYGFDLKQFTKELLRFFRVLMIAELLKSHNQAQMVSTYLDFTETELKDVESLSGLRS